MEVNNGFSYSYSASEEAELRAIRKRYAAKEQPSRLDEVKRLDKSVTGTATAVAIALGVIGSLLLGCGMSLIMTGFGQMLMLGEELSVVIGLILGVIGIAVVISAYPVYSAVYEHKKKKVGPIILALLDELGE